MAALGQAASDTAFERTVDMVTVMATEPDLRDRIRGRLEPVIDDDTRVVVAHSLDSVISHIALSNRPEWKVHTLETLGSPMAAEMLGSTVEGTVGGWPG